MYSILFNTEIIYCTSNIEQCHAALEEFAYEALETRCGNNVIQKKHIDFNGFYAIEYLDRIEIWRTKLGYLYNNRILVCTYQIVRYKKITRALDKRSTKFNHKIEFAGCLDEILLTVTRYEHIEEK